MRTFLYRLDIALAAVLCWLLLASAAPAPVYSRSSTHPAPRAAPLRPTPRYLLFPANTLAQRQCNATSAVAVLRGTVLAGDIPIGSVEALGCGSAQEATQNYAALEYQVRVSAWCWYRIGEQPREGTVCPERPS